MPRPQVRSDLPARVLPALRLLQQRRRARPRDRHARGDRARGTRSQAAIDAFHTTARRAGIPTSWTKERAWEATARPGVQAARRSRPRSRCLRPAPRASGPTAQKRALIELMLAQRRRRSENDSRHARPAPGARAEVRHHDGRSGASKAARARRTSTWAATSRARATASRPAFPPFLPPLPKPSPGTPPDRLDLARWLVDPPQSADGPGGGQPDLAGVFRPRPGRDRQRFRHPGVAAEPSRAARLAGLRAHGPAAGASRQIHRLIVTSATYRQSSRVRPELPGGRSRQSAALARQSRLRLDAELIRDAALACSGCSRRRIGGPSVFPPQPDGVMTLGQMRRAWKPSNGPRPLSPGPLHVLLAGHAVSVPDDLRRARRRADLHAPAPLEHAAPGADPAQRPGHRSRSPRRWPARVLRETAPRPSDAERIDHAFRLCLGRAPSPTESRTLRLLSSRNARGRPRTRSDRATLRTPRPGPARGARALEPRRVRDPRVNEGDARHDRDASSTQALTAAASRPAATSSAAAAWAWARWPWPRCSSEGSAAAAVEREPSNPLAARPGHFPARAKSVIYLFMAGGPSQLELFDYKPKLQQYTTSRSPTRSSRGAGSPSWTSSPRSIPSCWARPASSPATASRAPGSRSCLPHLAGVVDDLTFVRSVATDVFNHAPAKLFANTGSQQFGRPSMGSWVTYGIGSESHRPARASSCCSRARAARAAGRSTGGAASCPRPIRAFRSAPAASRSSNLATPPGISPATPAADDRGDPRA